MRDLRSLFAGLGAAVLLLAGCGDSDGESTTAAPDGGEKQTVVATTTILGDAVEMCFGDEVDVVTIMPVGADPHEFQASAQQANEIREADALIVNGEGFEAGMIDVIEAATADGAPTYEATSTIETIDFGEGGHDHSDEEHSEEGEEHSHDEEEAHTEDDHDHEGADPHFWTDPARMAVAVDGMAQFLVEDVDGVDAEAVESSAGECVTELEALDAAIEAALVAIPAEQRVLVTDHDSFGYFADRYGFEVVGTVIPSGSTADGASAGELAELAELIEAEDVPAIFVGTTVQEQLAETLAAEVGGDVEVVQLYTGSLGEPGSEAATYVGMLNTNAGRIADALG